MEKNQPTFYSTRMQVFQKMGSLLTWYIAFILAE